MFKKIITTLYLLTIKLLVSAQAYPCAQIEVSVFGLNPQSGAKNYFGITISLDKSYNQNITINGYIFDDGDYNTNHPFSLTITAGNRSVTTSSTFYETNPTASAAISLASSTPTIINSGSIAYSTECNFGNFFSTSVILNPNNPNDFVGSKHNLGVDYVMSGHVSSSSSIKNSISTFLGNHGYSTSDFDGWYSTATNDGFFSLDHIKFAENPDSLINLLYNSSRFNSTVKNYLHQIISLVETNIGVNNPSASIYNSYATAILSVENTVQSDNSLSAQEKEILLSIASVGRFSGAYWTNYYSNNLFVLNKTKVTQPFFHFNDYDKGDINAFSDEYSPLNNYYNISNIDYFKYHDFILSLESTSFKEAHFYGFWKWFKRVLKGDLAGAITGFFGAIFTGGLGWGAVIGGAVGGSVASGLELQ